MKTEVVLIILFVHWIADFVLQTNEMAIKKSSSNYFLTMHVLTYTVIFDILSIFILPLWIGFLWASVNGLLHWIQDYTTSRINANLWKKEKRWAFFVSIGADQYLHYAFLIGTYKAAEYL